MQYLLSLDVKLFYFINLSIANGFFDVVMPFVTHLGNWKIPILVIWLFLIIKGGKRGRVAAILIIPVLVLSDQLSASVFKPLVGRIRPCHALPDVRILIGCGGKYAFPSSHASNISAVAVIFSFFYRPGTVGFVLFAFIIGFSRIYVGVHYPGDVLFGFILGIFCGFLVIATYLKLSRVYPGIDYTLDLRSSNKTG